MLRGNTKNMKPVLNRKGIRLNKLKELKLIMTPRIFKLSKG